MTDALTGYGSEFWLENDADTLTEVGELIAIEPGSETWGTADATNFKSPGRRREYITTLIESGEGSFQLNWIPGNATDELISEAHSSGEAREFEIFVPKSGGGMRKISGYALVLSRTPTIPLDDRMTCQVTLMFTGPRTEADEVS